MSYIRSVFHGYGGAEIYMHNLAKYLVKNGIKVKVIVPAKGKEKRGRLEGVEYEFIRPQVPMDGKGLLSSFKSLLFYLLFGFELRERLENENFDIFHSFGLTSYFYLKSKDRKITVVQPFAIYGTYKPNVIKNIIRAVSIDRIVKGVLTQADAIASEGDIQTREIHEKFEIPLEKFFYLPIGIELSAVRNYILNSKLSRKNLGIDDADVVLININRLVKNKGVNYLIDALKILNEQHSINTKLILIGAGPEEEAIMKQIKLLNLNEKVLHFKNISDKLKFQLLALADILVHPSLFEGSPIATLEALAAGKPVVVTNVSEIPHVVRHGVNGILVPPRDPEAIAKAVLEIYENGLIEKMGRESKKIARNYDWDIIAKMAIRKYEELMEKNNTATI